MPINANTFSTALAKGNREDLDNLIYNISPTDTPFITATKKGKVSNVLFEWQTDSLASATNNVKPEGDIPANEAVAPTIRVQNYCQISHKTNEISGTQEAMNSAGRPKGEKSLQLAKRMEELKRDMEVAVLQNGTSIAVSTGRQTRGAAGWCATNCLVGVGGAAPNPTTNTAPTAGTARPLTEGLLKDLLRNIWVAGGDPTVIMCGGSVKQSISAMTGNATRMNEADNKKLYAGIDVYVSDFGTLKVVPNRFQESNTVFAFDMKYWELSSFRPIKVKDLAETGDSERFMVIAEYGLKSKQEAASGQIRDIS
jgi:hypothetical protein